MSKECFIYFNFLFFIINIIPSLAFENRYSTYGLDFSSEKQEFLVNTNSKFNFFLKILLGFILKMLKIMPSLGFYQNPIKMELCLLFKLQRILELLY